MRRSIILSLILATLLSATANAQMVKRKDVFKENSTAIWAQSTNKNVGIGTTTPVGGTAIMNGNLGVGTWSPTAKLQVVGTIALENSESISNATDGAIKLSSAIGGTCSEDITLSCNSTANKMVIGSGSGVTTLQTPAILQIGGEALQVMFTPTPNLGYRSGSSNTSSRWRVSPNGTPTVAEGGAIAAVEIFDNDAFVGSADYSLMNFYAAPDMYQINSKRGNDSTFHNKPIVFSNQDTNYLMIVDTTSATGNVGIGTWKTPSAKLVVEQTTAADAFRVNDSAADATPFIIGQEGNVGIGTVGPVQPLEVNGTAQMTGFKMPTGASAGYVLTSSSVGIGTWMPAASGAETDPQVGTLTNTKWCTTDGTQVNCTTDAPSGSGSVNSGGADFVAIYDTAGTAVSASAILSDNGTNVGISTVGPREKLEVNGNVRATTFIGNVTGNVSGSSGSTTGNAATVTTNANLTGPITSTGNATAIAAQTGTGSTFVVQAGPTLTTPILGVATGTSLTTSGNIGIGTTNISFSGLAVMTGNVGIGTWKPSAALQVVGGVTASGALAGSNFSGTSSGTNTGDNTVATTGDSATAFFSTGTIERAVGGLGTDTSAFGAGIIGSDGSNATIDIDTIAEIETAIGGATNIITETEMDAGSELIALYDDEVGTGFPVFNASPNFTGNVGIGTVAPVGGLIVMNGNVGIGTWSPTASLQVNGTGVFTTVTGANVTSGANPGHTHTTTSVSGIDIGDDTNLTGGRSLTLNGDDILADVELYTRTFCFNYPASPVDTDDNKSIWINDSANAFTVTKLWCESDQTVTTMLQVDDGTAADMDSVDLVCITTPDTDTSLDGDATIAAGDRVDVATTSVSGTPTWATVCFTGTYDD